VRGDIDAFIAYIESGQALQDWQTRLAAGLREFEGLFGDIPPAAYRRA
jgi:hypothetical protein